MIQTLEKEMTFRDKNILVVGLARSGTGSANLLSKLGAKVTVTDMKPGEALETSIQKLLPGIEIITGGNPQEVFDAAEIIVISPGVPSDAPFLVKAKIKGAIVISELELAYQTIRKHELRVSSEEQNLELTSLPVFIGVTGTNGKSTTTTLVDLMIRDSGGKTIFGGNIGYALTEGLNRLISADEALNVDSVVAEISSFQLETIKEFAPQIAAVLNITPDHLDRYDSMNDYIAAKARIFENQKAGDSLVLNADDKAVMRLYESRLEPLGSMMPDVFFFSLEKRVRGIYLKGDALAVSKDGAEERLINIGEIRLPGLHNLENAMAASLLALLSGCSEDSVKKVLRSFRGLEHRMELAGEIRGVRFINDSKGTNTGAVKKSLEGLEDIVLIMGGADKGGDFFALKELVEKKVKLLLLIGEAKEKIERALGKSTETVYAESLDDAVEKSLSKAQAGDVVLLSPGCASFDMFKDFEDRGRKFREAVSRLKNKH